MSLDADIAIGAIAAKISRIEGLYAGFAQKQGVSYALVQVLYELRLNSPVTQKQISQKCKIPKQTVNGIAKQLRAGKLIAVAAGKEDRREKGMKPTELGEAYIEETLKPFLELNRAVVDKIGMDLLRQLSGGLDTVGDAIELEMELKKISSRWEEGAKNAIP